MKMYTPVQMDKVRNFRYGMKAISFVEKKLGKPVGKIDFENMTMEDTATVILAGLIHEDNTLTTDKLMDIIDEKGNFDEVIAAMEVAFNESFGAGTQGKN